MRLGNSPSEVRKVLPEGVRERRLEMELNWRRRGFYRDQTLAGAMEEGASRFPNCRLVFDSEQRPGELGLRELVEQGRQVAGALARRGVGQGDVVAIQMPNWAETAIAYCASAFLGSVFVPIVQIYGPLEVGYIVRRSGAKALIVPSRFRRLDYSAGFDSLGETPELELMVTVGEAPAPEGAIQWTDLLSDPTPAEPSHERGPDDVAAMIFTSGTTAEPKAVMHSSNSLLAEFEYGPTPPQGLPGTVSFQPFPAGHTAGLSAMLGSFVHGCDTILVDIWKPDRAAQLVELHQVTAMAGTPIFFDTLLDAAEKNGSDLSSLVHGMTGGAGVPPALIERADQAGIKMVRCYGATEGPSMTAGKESDELGARSRTDGEPLPGVEIKIIDQEQVEVEPGTAGEIVAIGPEQFIGYLDPEHNIDAFTEDGWLRTGDIGVVDEKGVLTITDRVKDIIIRGGENISSKEIEDLLVEHPAVAATAVTGKPDARYGELVCAFVVLSEGRSLDLEEVREHFFEAGIARQKTPEHLVIVEEFPRTAAGKIQKHRLREQLVTGEARSRKP